MMNDTVREELQPKITSGNLPRIETAPPVPAAKAAVQPRPATPVPAAKKVVTAGLSSPKTSPTLVDFKHRQATLPDWRLQIQNAVQQRRGATAAAAAPAVALSAKPSVVLKDDPATADHIEKPPTAADPLVAKAMSRIAESRKVFTETPADAKAKQPPQRPFGVVSTPIHTGTATAAAPARVAAPIKPALPAKPTLVETPVITVKRDTNKLPPIDDVAKQEPVPQSSAARVTDVADAAHEATPSGRLVPEIKRIEIKLDKPITPAVDQEPVEDDIEDLAPFSMRFGAGLFDMIIAGFATLLLLSPLAFTNGNWFTAAGALTVAAAFALISFVYMTLCLGFYGKTMGMRLFSIELVDAVENEYPTLRQAAVNSAVFMLTLCFAGAGFITIFFNEEKRALHDLLSGTILVREF